MAQTAANAGEVKKKGNSIGTFLLKLPTGKSSRQPLQHSLTDPKSRSMKGTGGGFDYSFNAQTAVDGTAYIIEASEVVFTSSDLQQVHMVPDAVKTNMGAAPG